MIDGHHWVAEKCAQVYLWTSQQHLQYKMAPQDPSNRTAAVLSPDLVAVRLQTVLQTVRITRQNCLCLQI